MEGVPVIGLILIPFTTDRETLRAAGADLPLAVIPTVDAWTAPAQVTAMVADTWSLALQPAIADSRQAEWTEADGPQPPRYADHQAPRARIILLRENPDRAQSEGAGEGRPQWSHRWVVRGFYRMQPYGPQRSLRKRIWVPPYVKGPSGLPLIDKPQVMVWRR